jgi:hypothetical protein
MTDQPPAEAPKRPKRRTSQKRHRNKHLAIRLSDDELKHAAERAGRAGLSMSAYGRAAMLGDPGPDSQRRPSIDKELLLRTLATLAHLNHHADRIARSITTSDISEIRQIGKDYMLLRDAILAALPKSRRQGPDRQRSEKEEE